MVTDSITFRFCNIELNSISDNNADDTLNINRSEYRRTNDAAYDIFYAPYDPDNNDMTGVLKDSISRIDYPIHSDYILSLFTNMQTQLTSETIYDVQIVPYCPEPSILLSDGTIDIAQLSETQYTISSNGHGVIFFASTCNSSRDISCSISVSDNKTNYLTDKWVLTAPNYSSEYELPVYKNAGIDSINIDMTLLPYTP